MCIWAQHKTRNLSNKRRRRWLAWKVKLIWWRRGDDNQWETHSIQCLSFSMDWTAATRFDQRLDMIIVIILKYNFISLWSLIFLGEFFDPTNERQQIRNEIMDRELWRANFLTTLYLCSNNNGYNDYFVTVTQTHTNAPNMSIRLFKHSLFSLRQRNLLNSLTLFYWMAHKEKKKLI